MITLTNDFHNTQTSVRDNCGRLTKGQVKRSFKKLCGSKDCICGGVAGERGNQFFGKADERQQIWLSQTEDGGAEITGL